MSDIEAMQLDYETCDWVHAHTFAGTVRIKTSRGVFTITDNGFDVAIRCDQTLQVAPIGENGVAINEYRSPRGRSFPDNP